MKDIIKMVYTIKNKILYFISFLILSILVFIFKTLQINEITKAIFALIFSLFFFYYFLGNSFWILLSKLNKNNILEEVNFFPRYIFLWILGFFVFSTVVVFLILLGYILFTKFSSFFVYEFILKYLSFYLLAFIFLIHLFFEKPNDINLKSYFLVIFFVLISVLVILIPKLVTPFPLFGQGFASPSIDDHLTERWIEDGYFNTWRIFEVGS